ncbi:MAG: NifB/NifX family molybdenum-iron cluster-binding protein [Tepidanaerobacteraceae bacterium]|jgi:predicted Fe-Mo cluster-binding NifX family protein|nr:NifB/NifX family molybdenum-iron cluster-binding protein [Tepidanaerobacteraceae bacterium]
MKVAVTSSGSDLDSMVDERFGRCRYFIFADSDTKQFEAVENEYASGAHGTGVQVAQFIADKKASALITGNVGPNAMRVLMESGIEVYTAHSMSVKQALEHFEEGKLSMASGPTTKPHM